MTSTQWWSRRARSGCFISSEGPLYPSSVGGVEDNLDALVVHLRFQKERRRRCASGAD